MSTCGSNDLVTDDDVLWPWNVTVVTSICLEWNICKIAGDRRSFPIGNSIWRNEWSHEQLHRMTPKGQTSDRICFQPFFSIMTGNTGSFQNSTYWKWHLGDQTVICSMSSRVPVFLFGTDYNTDTPFIQANRKYRKTASIIQKLQFITLLTAILCCYTHQKQQNS